MDCLVYSFIMRWPSVITSPLLLPLLRSRRGTIDQILLVPLSFTIAFDLLTKVHLLKCYAKQFWLSQPFLKGEMFQSLTHLRVLLLESLGYIRVSLALGSPKLDPVLSVWPHQCWAEGKDYCPPSAGDALPNAAKDTISLLCRRSHFNVHVQRGVHKDPLFFFFCQAALQLVGPLIWVQLNKRWVLKTWNQGFHLKDAGSKASESSWLGEILRDLVLCFGCSVTFYSRTSLIP